MSSHLAQKNITYFEHLCQAWHYSYHLIRGGVLCFIHGIFPNLFVTSASDTVFYLHHQIQKTELIQSTALIVPNTLPTDTSIKSIQN